MRHGHWEHTLHLCRVPDRREVRDAEAGQGSIWVCHCGHRWRLVINVGRASWLNLGNEHKVWVGRL